MAAQILRVNGGDKRLGQNWVPNFLKRNPQVASVVESNIKVVRATAANSETIRSFFEFFHCVRIQFDA